jgi:hypothetical protein
MNFPENGHFTATSENITDHNIEIRLRKLGCKEEILVREADYRMQ